MTSPEIAVLAEGAMGTAVVRRLLGAGFSVWAWDEQQDRADALTAEGAWVTSSPAIAAAEAAVVITLLQSGDSTAEAMIGYEGAAPAMRPGSLWLQLRGVDAHWREGFATLAEAHGIEYVDAPVAGDEEAAERGRLIVLAYGAESIRTRAQPIFDAISRHTRWFDSLGPGGRRTPAARPAH
jgi:3-hydroxyisobutyrate dehydrogenase